MPDSKEESHLRPWSKASYRIEVEGRLEENWSNSFAGMRITYKKRKDLSVITCLTGCLRDQAELTGVLNGLAEMHLPILSVKNIDKIKGG